MAIETPIRAPLHRTSPTTHHFVDGAGNPVVLAGIHHGWELVDRSWGQPLVLDYDRFLDRVVGLELNLLRLWTVEHTQGDERPSIPEAAPAGAPMPFVRTGPGEALDGRPRFDLEQLDLVYFDRLERRIERAGARGIYVIVMLFQGVSVWNRANWSSHYLNGANNVQGLDGDTDGDGIGNEVHQLGRPEVLAVQERYVAELVRRLADHPNVLWEIANEDREGSLEWQLHWVRFLREAERDAGVAHPIGLTFRQGDGTNEEILAAGVDWVSIDPGDRHRIPPADPRAVSLLDTDHFWPRSTDPTLPWKAFAGAHGFLALDELVPGTGADLVAEREPLRRALTAVRRLAVELDLDPVHPSPGISSSGYCLRAPWGLLVYLPRGRRVRLELGEEAYRPVWIDPDRGERIEGDRSRTGRTRLRAPAPPGRQGWVLLLERQVSPKGALYDPPPRSGIVSREP